MNHEFLIMWWRKYRLCWKRMLDGPRITGAYVPVQGQGDSRLVVYGRGGNAGASVTENEVEIGDMITLS